MKCLMQSIPAGLILAMTGALVALTGCQTTGSDSDSSGLVPPPTIPFKPIVSKVPIQTGEGRYPNLFTGASYAIWGAGNAMAALSETSLPTMEAEMPPEATGMSREEGGASMGDKTDGVVAEEMTPESADATGQPRPETPDVKMAMSAATGPVVIQCYLESRFSDMSIAYDAVGLRGVQLYLLLPDGTEVLPVQRELDSELSEESVGALRRFGRKITLYFPRQVIMVDNPAVTPGATGVQLVLEGHDSQFFFAWSPAPNHTASAKPPRWDQDALRLSKSVSKKLFAGAKRISHEFD